MKRSSKWWTRRIAATVGLVLVADMLVITATAVTLAFQHPENPDAPLPGWFNAWAIWGLLIPAGLLLLALLAWAVLRLIQYWKTPEEVAKHR